MTILVFGASGQVGRALQALADVTALGRDAANLNAPEQCAAAILDRSPTAVINAAAYTAVDHAEQDEDTAMRINAFAPAAMAEACVRLDVPFVHISTDYVFSGRGETPWRPDDPTHPQNVYGRSKRAGERGVLAAGGRCAVVRTAWVFSATGANFVKTMLRLSQTRSELSVVDDQVGGPTPARDLAQACLTIADQLQTDPGKAGVYHYSGAPDVSWCVFARSIFSMAGLPVSVSAVGSEAYPTAARRPLNSRLDCSTTRDVFGLDRPAWIDGLKAVLTELAHDGRQTGEEGAP